MISRNGRAVQGQEKGRAGKPVLPEFNEAHWVNAKGQLNLLETELFPGYQTRRRPRILNAKHTRVNEIWQWARSKPWLGPAARF